MYICSICSPFGWLYGTDVVCGFKDLTARFTAHLDIGDPNGEVVGMLIGRHVFALHSPHSPRSFTSKSFAIRESRM